MREVTVKDNTLNSSSYCIHSVDLKDLQSVQSLFIETILKNHSPEDIEICFIFECVLVYMPVEDSKKILSYFSSEFPRASVVSYEQVNLDDRFGQG